MADDLDSKLASIARFAAGQKARVSSVTVDGISFVLEPDAQQMPQGNSTSTDSTAPNAFDDPVTYGFPEGSKPPGFTDPRRKAGQ